MGDSDVPREELGNDLRRDIFVELLEQQDPLTPTELGERLDEPREQIHYHLDVLVRMGIVVSQDGSYRCQEVFFSAEFQESVTAMLGTLTPLAEQHVEVPDELDDDQDKTVLRNCVRLSVAMNIR